MKISRCLLLAYKNIINFILNLYLVSLPNSPNNSNNESQIILYFQYKKLCYLQIIYFVSLPPIFISLLSFCFSLVFVKVLTRPPVQCWIEEFTEFVFVVSFLFLLSEFWWEGVISLEISANEISPSYNLRTCDNVGL